MSDPASESLSQTCDRLWSCLESGVNAQRSPFTMVQAATLRLDGAPKVRTIVLRQVSRADRLPAETKKQLVTALDSKDRGIGEEMADHNAAKGSEPDDHQHRLVKQSARMIAITIERKIYKMK